jgi:hypothetical protein
VHVKRQNLENSQNLKTKYAKHWKIFEECANILVQYPDIDYRRFVRFAVDIEKSDYILPKVLTSLKTFSRFNETNGFVDVQCPIENRFNGIISSCTNIAKLMTEHDLKTLSEFMQKFFTVTVVNPTPLIFEQYMRGKITTECILLLPGWSNYIKTYPNDIRYEMRLDPLGAKSLLEKMSKQTYNKKKLIDIDVVNSILMQLGDGIKI